MPANRRGGGGVRGHIFPEAEGNNNSITYLRSPGGGGVVYREQPLRPQMGRKRR